MKIANFEVLGKKGYWVHAFAGIEGFLLSTFAQMGRLKGAKAQRNKGELDAFFINIFVAGNGYKVG